MMRPLNLGQTWGPHRAKGFFAKARKRLFSAEEGSQSEQRERGAGRFRHDFEGRVLVLHRAAVRQGVLALDHVSAVGQIELQRAYGEEEVFLDEVPAAVVRVLERSVVQLHAVDGAVSFLIGQDLGQNGAVNFFSAFLVKGSRAFAHSFAGAYRHAQHRDGVNGAVAKIDVGAAAGIFRTGTRADAGAFVALGRNGAACDVDRAGGIDVVSTLVAAAYCRAVKGQRRDVSALDVDGAGVSAPAGAAADARAVGAGHGVNFAALDGHVSARLGAAAKSGRVSRALDRNGAALDDDRAVGLVVAAADSGAGKGLAAAFAGGDGGDGTFADAFYGKGGVLGDMDAAAAAGNESVAAGQGERNNGALNVEGAAVGGRDENVRYDDVLHAAGHFDGVFLGVAGKDVVLIEADHVAAARRVTVHAVGREERVAVFHAELDRAAGFLDEISVRAFHRADVFVLAAGHSVAAVGQMEVDVRRHGMAFALVKI